MSVTQAAVVELVVLCQLLGLRRLEGSGGHEAAGGGTGAVTVTVAAGPATDALKQRPGASRRQHQRRGQATGDGRYGRPTARLEQEVGRPKQEASRSRRFR